MSSPWVHLHAHSEYSALDGMSHVEDMVARAVKLRQPALALTDHGVMSGSIALYKECRKAGIEPIIGMEAYLVERPDRPTGKATEDRYHLTVLARNYEGYKALVRLSSRSHTRERYHRKPRLVLADFAEVGAENLTVLTGCYFGALQQAIVQHGPERARRVLQSLAHVFPHLYVEVQNHGTEHDGGFTDHDLADTLYDLAKTEGIMPVVTQDSHYCLQAHKPAHHMMKHLVIHGSGNVEFPGDSYHLCSTKWAREHFDWSDNARSLWQDNLVAMQGIVEDTGIRIPVLEKYRWYVPSISVDPLQRITERCQRRLKVKPLDPKQRPKYAERLAYELSIIEDTGFAGYFDLVSDYVDWCKEQDPPILVNARGSANGSLVAWLLGITAVDPVEWGLMVERFIDRSRKRPPDIDLDIEQNRRGEVIDYISSRFNVAQIGTFLTMSLSEEDGGKGSIFVNYLGYKRRTLSPDQFQRDFQRQDGRTLIEKIQDHDADEFRALQLLNTLRVRRSTGVHPAGFVLDGPGHSVDDIVPKMLIPSSNTMVTQYQMDEVEDLGFIKIDLLGLRSLTVLRRCQEMIGRPDPTNLSWIPLDDPLACKTLSDAVYESAIFQMEGWTMARGVKDMKIRRTADCVAAVALFRPALLEPGYDKEYLRNRNPRTRSVTYPHPIFKRHLGPTYGIPLYQEQVLEVLRDLGVSPDSLNDVLKAVKGKQGGRDAQRLFDATRRHYETLAEQAGMDAEQTEAGWELVEGFVGYGFNKAHAVAYGLMAYRAGYLKAHYPLAYMAAALESVGGTDKESAYLKEARRLGLKIMRADVNDSGVSWTLVERLGAIRRGLTSVKGIGVAAANTIVENAPYDSMDDFVARTGRQVTGKADYKKGGWRGTLAILKDAGALGSLGILP